MLGTLDSLRWPVVRLDEALEAARDLLTLDPETGDVGPPPPHVLTGGKALLGSWIESAAARLGFDAEHVTTPYVELDAFLRNAGPSLIRVRRDDSGSRDERGFLLVLETGRHRVVLLAPDFTRVDVQHSLIKEALCADLEGPIAGRITQILAAAGSVGRRAESGRQALLKELLNDASIDDCWLLRPDLGRDLKTQAREAGLPMLAARVLVAHAAAYALFLASFWLLGLGAFNGQLDTGWLLAWLLLLSTLIPCRLLAVATGGRLAIGTGTLIRRRLMFEALRLNPDAIRHLGVGRLLGRAIEGESIESMAVKGGIAALTALVDLVFSGLVLAAGAAGSTHVLLLAASVVAAIVLTWLYYRRQGRWTEERLRITGSLVELMTGHRTRLAQEPSNHWHDGEDGAMTHYLDTSRNVDRLAVAIQVLLPGGWLILSLLAIAPSFIMGEPLTVSLAVSLGGIFLANFALRALATGLLEVAAVMIAWDHVRRLWEAGLADEPRGDPEYVCPPPPASDVGHARATAHPLMEIRNVSFRFQGRTEPVVREATLAIRPGDRIIMVGPSGGGKSSMVRLMSGFDRPTSGLILLDGLDRETLGTSGWRNRVAVAPQFHENYVIRGPLALNMLMGRDWPPRESDLVEAYRIGRALGLEPLLKRMPGGIMQSVGERGWQLSHGEKSRVYLARALLQDSEFIILDESFAALDPLTLQAALESVLREERTLLIIEHI